MIIAANSSMNEPTSSSSTLIISSTTMGLSEMLSMIWPSRSGRALKPMIQLNAADMPTM